MRVALDCIVGKNVRHLLKTIGHEIVTMAQEGEDDISWFGRALQARAELIVTRDRKVQRAARAVGLLVVNPPRTRGFAHEFLYDMANVGCREAVGE